MYRSISDPTTNSVRRCLLVIILPNQSIIRIVLRHFTAVSMHCASNVTVTSVLASGWDQIQCTLYGYTFPAYTSNIYEPSPVSARRLECERGMYMYLYVCPSYTCDMQQHVI